VAHSLSAKKRVRQNIKRRARNRSRKGEIRDQVKVFQADLAAGNFDKAEQDLRKAAGIMAQVATKGTIHKNAASRRRSRLQRRLNTARAAKGAGTTAAKA
jgi:small subunit ribosomal protein S20